MLFIKSLPETTNGLDVFNEVLRCFSNENTPLTNLINIASDGAAGMAWKSERIYFYYEISYSSHPLYPLYYPQTAFNG